MEKNPASYKFEKRKKEIARQKKQDEKRQRQLEKKQQEKQGDSPLDSPDALSMPRSEDVHNEMIQGNNKETTV